MENTRLVRHKDIVYKVRVTCEYEKHSIKKLLEITEPVLRALLYAESREKWMKNVHLDDSTTVQCSKKLWKAAEKFQFLQNGRVLQAYPYMFTFCVQQKIAERECIKSSSAMPQSVEARCDESCQVILERDSTIGNTKQNLTTRVSKRLSNVSKGHTESSSGVNAKKHLHSTSRQKEVSSSAKSKRKASQTTNLVNNHESASKKLRICKKNTVSTTISTVPESSCVSRLDSLHVVTTKSSSCNVNNNNSSSCVCTEDKRSTRSQLLILPQRRDRHEIEEEQIEEDMKLQSLARTTSVVHKNSPSGLWKILDTLLLPVRMLTRSRIK